MFAVKTAVDYFSKRVHKIEGVSFYILGSSHPTDVLNFKEALNTLLKVANAIVQSLEYLFMTIYTRY